MKHIVAFLQHFNIIAKTSEFHVCLLLPNPEIISYLHSGVKTKLGQIIKMGLLSI